MSSTQAIIIFAVIVAAALFIAVVGILLNIKKAAKLFKDDQADTEETEKENNTTDK